MRLVPREAKFYELFAEFLCPFRVIGNRTFRRHGSPIFLPPWPFTQFYLHLPFRPQPVPIIRQHPKDPIRSLSLVRWGLIPSWSKTLPARRGQQPLNFCSQPA